MKFSQVVAGLLEQPDAHARFVNTLSMLEYIGARKILKSQEAERMSMRILGHAAEEIRHAQILKGLALQLSDGRLWSYEDEHLLCGNEARAYIQSLDQACAASLSGKDAAKNYALTTLLIEERAMKVYPEYEEILRKRGIPNALKAIIKDEDKHLAETREDVEPVPGLAEGLQRLRAFEEDRFNVFLRAVAETRASAVI